MYYQWKYVLTKKHNFEAFASKFFQNIEEKFFQMYENSKLIAKKWVFCVDVTETVPVECLYLLKWQYIRLITYITPKPKLTHMSYYYTISR